MHLTMYNVFIHYCERERKMFINFDAMVKIFLWATCKFAKWGNLYTIISSFHVELYPQIKMAAHIFWPEIFLYRKRIFFFNFIISCKIRDHLRKNDIFWHITRKPDHYSRNRIVAVSHVCLRCCCCCSIPAAT